MYLATDFPSAVWRKTRRSSGNSNCVEVAKIEVDGETKYSVRDSKDPEGPALVFTKGEYAAFIEGVKDGEFDITDS